MPVTVIGSGFSGLSAAAYLSAAGHEVHVFEKNAEPGGRARQMITPEGYTFDMGPSWYWMPDVFEKFFSDFGHTSSSFYSLKRLDPSFEIVFGKNDTLDIPSSFDEFTALFEETEPGSGIKLKKFMKEAELKYRLSMDKFVHMPALTIREYISPQLFYNALQIQLFTSFRTHLSRYFSNPRLLALMEFPVLFLGGTAENTPALYSLMNYAGLSLGTWYPMGGFGKVIEAMKQVAEEAGTKFHFHASVEKIKTEGDYATAVKVNGAEIMTDGIVASADYHHVENQLLSEEMRNYKNGYWNHKTMSPSCLIYFLGIRKKINRLQHHTLFFDEDLNLHAKEIYQDQRWPQRPLFYVCCPSKTDPGVAPEGHENLFLLMPIASGLEDTAERRAFYFDEMMGRLETLAGEAIRPFIEFQKSYCINDFISDYNAYKGNAYGLANTLNQTAVLRPKIKNHKLKNLFYAGQLTVPGPGVPPAIISGKIAARLLHKQLVHA